MRYTEAQLQLLAELLSEINLGTTSFRATYDGQLEEPITLPAQVPNLLINGASGIAVGMATNIPPHNLTEIIDALVSMIDDPLVDLIPLWSHQGPGFSNWRGNPLFAEKFGQFMKRDRGRQIAW